MYMHSLNIRRKLTIALIAYFLIVTAIAGTAVLNISKIDRQFTLVSHTSQLNHLILKMRHYEEEYLFGQQGQDYERIQSYMDSVRDNLLQIEKEMVGMRHLPYVEELIVRLAEYNRAVESLHNMLGSNSTNPTLFAEVISLGDGLAELTYTLVEGRQQKVARLLALFKQQFALIVAGTMILSGSIIVWMWYAVFKPLKKIAIAANAVADGTFRPFPLGKGGDETHRVLSAFNRMVHDLKQRQEQLVEVKKLSSLGTLASGTAHQLNNPLNNISTSCQIALSELEDGDLEFIKKMLNTIQQESVRAGEIVRGLLEFSRSQPYYVAPVLVKEVVERVQRLVASEVPAGIDIKTVIADDLLVEIDTQKMTEAFLNLVINGIQAIGNESGEIVIAGQADHDQQKAIITISDTGEGIDKENIKKLFDPFFTTKTEKSGTGLGLSIVYGIIQKHHGRITVQSEKGQGSVFTITLPLFREDQEVAASTEYNE